MHNKINKKTPSRIDYLEYFNIYTETEKNNPYIQAVRERQKAFWPRAKDLEIHK